MSRYVLTPENYDGVTSALIGNGELCTTVGPTGFHTPPEEQTDIAHKTQHFVMAGRRKSGPQHPLINFGTISRSLLFNDKHITPDTWSQEIWDVSPGVRSTKRTMRIASMLHYGQIMEMTTSSISLAKNEFHSSISFMNFGRKRPEVAVEYLFQFGEPSILLDIDEDDTNLFRMEYGIEGHLGTVSFGLIPGVLDKFIIESARLPLGARFVVQFRLDNEERNIDLMLRFSDRLKYELPIQWYDQKYGEQYTMCEEFVAREEAAQEFWSRSDVTTGDETVDRFRTMSLYTLRCQTTPWSIPPTVSEPYWGAGTFHDEMYPFLGLLSSNHTELAEHVPYFRLSTLPQAMQTARGKGALYPWSSTEYGEERDPNGLWLTERFHLGQFSVCIWMLWLYNRDRVQLDDLYPVLKEIARYFELNVLERDPEGKLGTKPCVDFDESVGEVKNGPFTICAAIASLEYAANAAEILSRNIERIPRWRAAADELKQNCMTIDDGRWTMPGGKPLHYSILGPIFPFRMDVDSPIAVATAKHIHEVCRSTKGWKPGFSEVFEGSNWIWTAAHLGIAHALQGNGDLAWEAIKAAPESAGPFLSPNEHVDKDGVAHVPWFTTGCGGWLYALNCLFVQVDENGTKLLPAVPTALPNAKFKDLRADYSVLVSGEFRDGQLISLTARAPQPLSWRFRIPAKYVQQNKPVGRIVKTDRQLLEIEMDELGMEYSSLLVL